MALKGTMIFWSSSANIRCGFDVLEAHKLGKLPRNNNKTRLRRAMIAVKDTLQAKFEAAGHTGVKCPDHQKTDSDTYELIVPTIEHTATGPRMNYISVMVVSVNEKTAELAFRPANAGDTLDNDLVEAVKTEFEAAATYVDVDQIRDLLGRHLTSSHDGCRGVSLMAYSGGAPFFVPETRDAELGKLLSFLNALQAANAGNVQFTTMLVDGDKAEMAHIVDAVERNAGVMIQKEIDQLVADMRLLASGTSQVRTLKTKANEAQQIKEKIANYSSALTAKQAEFLAWADKAIQVIDREVDTYEKNRPLTGSEFQELFFGAAPAPVAPAPLPAAEFKAEPAAPAPVVVVEPAAAPARKETEFERLLNG